MKYPEKGAGGPEPGSLPGFPCSPTSYMAAISKQLQAARQPFSAALAGTDCSNPVLMSKARHVVCGWRAVEPLPAW